MRRLVFLGILIISLSFIVNLEAQERKEAEELYTIRKGDTLWDISSKYLKDPFLWPKLWQKNPFITNPHWIYPGQKINILQSSSEMKKEETKEIVTEEKLIEKKPTEEKLIEEKPKEVLEEKETVKEKLPPPEEKREVSVEAKPKELKPEEVKQEGQKPPFFPETRAAGFLNDMDFRGIGIILESKEGKNLFSQGDIVYLSFKTSQSVSIGDRYMIFRPSEKVKHPLTDEIVGRKYNIIGSLQIIDQHGNFFTGMIVESFDAIIKGDMLSPYIERMEARERN